MKFSSNCYQVQDINTQLVDEDCDWDVVEDDLDYLCGELNEESEKNSDNTEQSIHEPLDS